MITTTTRQLPTAKANIIVGLLAALAFLGLGIFCEMDYRKAQALVADLDWTVCNSTSFRIDSDGKGFAAVSIQEPQPCFWPCLQLFECRKDDARCLRDNTHRFNNDAWSCVFHRSSPCATPVWTDWPDVEKAYSNHNLVYLYFVGAGLLFVVTGVAAFWLWRLRWQAPASGHSELYS